MKKKIIAILVFALILCLSASANYRWKADFLSTAVNCAAAETLINGTGFTSLPIRVSNPGDPDSCSIIITYTRAVGSALMVDFEFEVSCDGGTTWTTAYFVKLSAPTNETAVTNTVRKLWTVGLNGISHIRLSRIVNNDTAIALTACNVTISL